MTTYLNSDACNTIQVYSWDSDIKPMFGKYQLLGDSLFVRFAEHILEQRISYVNGARSIGLCVSGQRIDQLREKIDSNYYQVTKCVMILIGTNDVLSGGDIYVMMKHFKKLLKVTQKHAEKVIILTLPPIPRLCVTYKHWTLIRKYNYFLKSLDDINVRVIDICDMFTRCKGVFSYPINFDSVLNHRKSLSVKKVHDRKKIDIIKGIKRKSDDINNISDIHNSNFSFNSVGGSPFEIKRKKLNCTETLAKVDNGSRHVECWSDTSMDKEEIKSKLWEDSRFVDNLVQKKEANKHKDDYYYGMTSKLHDNQSYSEELNDSNNNLGRDDADNGNMTRKRRTDGSPRLFLKSLQDVSEKSHLGDYQKKLLPTDLNWSVLDEEERQKSVKVEEKMMLTYENWSDNDDKNEPDWDKIETTTPINKWKGDKEDWDADKIETPTSDKKNWDENKIEASTPINNGKGYMKNWKMENWDEDSYKYSAITEKMQDSSDSEPDVTNFRFSPQMKGYFDKNFITFIRNLPGFKGVMAEQIQSRIRGKYNNDLKHLSEKDKKIFEYSEVICFLDCYEKFYGKNYNRVDMIHLNYKGLDMLRRHLLENELVDF